MKLKKVPTDSLPTVNKKRIEVTCPCGRTFLQWWRKGTVRRVYCNACRELRRKEQKEQFRIREKGGK